MVEIRELDQIQAELEVLHERSQSNKLNIASHEATCEERYHNILQMLDSAQKQHDQMHKEILALNNLAAQGQSTIKTLFYVGGFVTAVAGFIYMLMQIFPRWKINFLNSKSKNF